MTTDVYTHGHHEDVYTHGHHESVLRSHSWRTAANSAAHLLPHLREGQRLLDVGCGPGATCVARATVMVPGPHPASSSRCPSRRCGSRWAAELAAVRQLCDRSTLSWWPWV